MTSRSFWGYYKDEVDNVNDSASNGKLFKYKTKTTRKQRQDLHKAKMMEKKK